MAEKAATILALSTLLLQSGCDKNNADTQPHQGKALESTRSAQALRVNSMSDAVPQWLPASVEARKHHASDPKLLLLNIKDLHFSAANFNDQSMVPLVSQHSKELLAAFNAMPQLLSSCSVAIFEDYTPARIEEIRALQKAHQNAKVLNDPRAQEILLEAYSRHGAPAVQAIVHRIEPIAGITPALDAERSVIAAKLKSEYEQNGRLSESTAREFAEFNTRKEGYLNSLIVTQAEKARVSAVMLTAGFAHQFSPLTNRGIALIELRTPTAKRFVQELKANPNFKAEMSGVE